MEWKKIAFSCKSPLGIYPYLQYKYYTYLHKPLGLRECVVGDVGGDECPHANEVGVQATRTGVHGYCGWPLPCGCGLGGVLTGD